MAASSRLSFTLVLIWALSPGLTAARADGPGTPLTVMTYNIGAYAPTVPLGPVQMAQIAQEIKEAQADVVGMTEVDIGTRNGTHPYLDMVAEIDAALIALDYPMDHYQTQTLVYSGGYGVIVIWSRYSITATGYEVTWLNYPEIRKVARATIQCAPDSSVHCFMTHYYIGDAEAYQHQTDVILDYVLSHHGPRVLMGDFNFTSSSIYYDQVMAAGLEDACISAGQSDCLTVGTGAGVPAPLPRVAQIDFIFGTDDVDFFDAYVPGSTVSDHWPLVASGLIPPARPAIACWPATLAAEINGCAGPESHVFAVANSGAGVLQYSITQDFDWLEVHPVSGTSVYEADEISATYDIAGLQAGSYQATVTVADPEADNSPYTIPVSLTVRIPGDFDGDGDVDQEDFGRFQACMTPRGAVQDDPHCALARLDSDRDVDRNDLALFQTCMTGPNLEGSTTCACQP